MKKIQTIKKTSHSDLIFVTSLSLSRAQHISSKKYGLKIVIKYNKSKKQRETTTNYNNKNKKNKNENPRLTNSIVLFSKRNKK